MTIEDIMDAAPHLMIGMGTIRTPQDVQDSIDAGVAFLVSPGAGPALLSAIRDCGAPAARRNVFDDLSRY